MRSRPAALRLAILAAIALAAPCWASADDVAIVTVEVGRHGKPLAGAFVRLGESQLTTDAAGRARFQVPAGTHPLVVEAVGYDAAEREVTAAAGPATTVRVDLSPLAEEVVVGATRSGTRVQDEPLRVEVLDLDEIEEKALMSPGSIAMLLGETPGLRIQPTVPSLGAAGLRIRGLPGHYSLLLSDGLPLHGTQGDSFGPLQVPPADLGQVEIVKGAASALYGMSALGGVVNLIPRRAREAEGEFLINSSSLGATDATGWLGRPGRLAWTALVGFHGQLRRDIDGDGWTDVAGYGRGVVRPRLFYDDGRGGGASFTLGFLGENREGGTVDGGFAPDGGPFAESLRTRALDVGGSGRRLLERGWLVSARAAYRHNEQERRFGTAFERGARTAWLAEASLQGASGRHTWVGGLAVAQDRYDAEDLPAFDYSFTTPALFAQDTLAFSPRLSLALSARADSHSEYGGLLSPRLSLLSRPSEPFTLRVSLGLGALGPTPFVERTDGTGFSRLRPLAGLEAEGALSASADATWRQGPFELGGALFSSQVRRPVALRVAGPESVELVNAPESTRAWGLELLARYRHAGFLGTLGYVLTDASELDVERGVRRDLPLTPRQTLSFTLVVEGKSWGRAGIEAYYVGSQALDDDPYLEEGKSHVLIGALVERAFGRLRVFLNLENLLGVRQTDEAPLVRPTRHPDGRWTVDAWAPLDGRVLNGGLRVFF